MFAPAAAISPGSLSASSISCPDVKRNNDIGSKCWWVSARFDEDSGEMLALTRTAARRNESTLTRTAARRNESNTLLIAVSKFKYLKEPSDAPMTNDKKFRLINRLIDPFTTSIAISYVLLLHKWMIY